MLSKDYIAGLFDGEGFFTLRRVRGAPGITVRPWRYQAYAVIVMREKDLLDEVVASLGYGWSTPYKGETERHAAYHNFGATGTNLERFCEDIGPRLRIKRAQAKLIHEVCTIKRRVRNQRVSDADYERQVEIWEALKRLNTKGPEKRVYAEAMVALAETVAPVAIAAWREARA